MKYKQISIRKSLGKYVVELLEDNADREVTRKPRFHVGLGLVWVPENYDTELAFKELQEKILESLGQEILKLVDAVEEIKGLTLPNN